MAHPVRASLLILARNRPRELATTLDQIAAIDPPDCELIVVDNDSDPPANVPDRVGSLPVRTVRLDKNRGAAGRNAGAAVARGQWLIMLDDDSAPLDNGFLCAIEDAPEDLAAIGAEILLPSGAHEAGGLPEVVVGCGAAIRAIDFRAAGGYDPDFLYYAEEYDLCAKLIGRGARIAHDPRFRVEHRKAKTGRDAAHIIERLVRNEGVVVHRYAPEAEREAVSRAWLERRQAIAARENVPEAFDRGRRALAAALTTTRRSPLTTAQWERFIGRRGARDHLAAERDREPFQSAAVVMPDGPPGKGAEEIRRALADLDIPETDPESADAIIVGTLSPGPASDAAAELARASTARVINAAPVFSRTPAPAR